MPDYDLSRLTPRGFEQLIQSLVLKVLSPGLVIFGDGPDGAREATYEGRLEYPNAKAPWEGYLVIQAKFKQKSEGTTKDGKWLVEQLKADLAKFKKRKDLRKPEYYLLCTNVTLSASAHKGAKDLAFSTLSTARKSGGIRDFDLWDYDKIRSFLDDAPEITRVNSAWITPGDVLSQAMKALKTDPDFSDIIRIFLQRELLADEHVNLKQAGHVSDKEAQIARVFVDLPFSGSPISESEFQAIAREANRDAPPNFLRFLLELGNERLIEGKTPTESRGTPQGKPRRIKESANPSASSLRKAHRGDRLFLLLTHHSDSDAPTSRIVVVGGPGQGKSTIGQHACQLYRTALLLDAKRVSKEAKDVIANTVASCKKDGFELPLARRFPLRIVLNDFASWLTHAPGASLISYIAERVKVRTDHQIKPSHLRQWLNDYPWFLVLDGLDEVPASSNRDAVLAAIQDFWIETTEADVLVVATTRPQGYNEEFSPRYYKHLYLRPLSPVQALHYAERLAAARYGHDDDRRRKVLVHLKKASETEATARLMRSPLQVTIMATLVDQSGPPPEDRWRLFHDYFDVIYRREVERPLPINTVLRVHRDLVKRIHDDVGLLLQIESERAGRTAARLTLTQVREIILRRLTLSGHQQDISQSLADQILEAAANRLVFLVGVEQGRIGFEIRSLQEFFAADAIMEGDDNQVTSRLESIAPHSHWRNTFLFAASRCGSQREYLRTHLLGLCSELNSSQDPLLRLSRAGSLLALDLLQEISAECSPKHALALFESAWEVTSRPLCSHQVRLAGLFKPFWDQPFRRRLAKHLAEAANTSQGAWWVGIQLYRQAVDWVIPLVREHWPTHANLAKTLLQDDRGPVDDFFGMKSLELLPDLPLNWPFALPDQLSVDIRTALELTPSLPWLTRKAITVLTRNTKGTLVIRLMPSCFDAHGYLRAISALDLVGPYWAIMRLYLEFALNKVTLAEVLRRTGEVWEESGRLVPKMAPWPIAKCLDQSDSRSDLEALAELALAGKLGETYEYDRLESEWEARGITLEEVAQQALKGFGLTTPPLEVVTINHHDASLYHLIQDCLAIARTSPFKGIGDIVLILLGSMELAKGAKERKLIGIDPNVLKLCGDRPRSWFLAGLACLEYRDQDREMWIEIANERGAFIPPRNRGNLAVPRKLAAWIEEELNANPDRPGLVVLLAAMLPHDKEVGLNLGQKFLSHSPTQTAEHAHTLLQLGQPGLRPTDADRLVPLAIKAMRETDWAATAIPKVLADRHSETEFIKCFLYKAYEQCEATDFAARQELMKAIDAQIERGVSGWNMTAKRAELGILVTHQLQD